MEIRPYRDDDAPAVGAFYAASARLDPTIEPVPEESWRSFTHLSFNHGARDFAVAEDAGRIIGLLTSTRKEDPVLRHFRIIVHPEHRRSGIATAMLRLVERQGEDSTAPLQTNCHGAWKAGIAFLQNEGFEPVFTMLTMERPGEAPPSLTVPEGSSFRSYEPGPDDDAAWIRLHDAGYRDDPDYTAMTPEDIAALRPAAGFHVWFCEHDGEAVGMCHTQDDHVQGKAWVHSVVVTEPFRGHGLGRALMVAGIRTLSADGPRPVGLSVDAPKTAAIALYRSLGFETIDEMRTWRKLRSS